MKLLGAKLRGILRNSPKPFHPLSQRLRGFSSPSSSQQGARYSAKENQNTCSGTSFVIGCSPHEFIENGEVILTASGLDRRLEELIESVWHRIVNSVLLAQPKRVSYWANAFAIRSCICSGVRSSMWLAIDQRCPEGSFTIP